MKELLERWATLEPHLCRCKLPYFIVGTKDCDKVVSAKDMTENDLAWIQWAVQQAIIEKGWYFLIRYNNGLCMVETGSVIPSPRYTKDDAEITEVLLSAYLAELEASANP